MFATQKGKKKYKKPSKVFVNLFKELVLLLWRFTGIKRIRRKKGQRQKKVRSHYLRMSLCLHHTRPNKVLLQRPMEIQTPRAAWKDTKVLPHEQLLSYSPGRVPTIDGWHKQTPASSFLVRWEKNMSSPKNCNSIRETCVKKPFKVTFTGWVCWECT